MVSMAEAVSPTTIISFLLITTHQAWALNILAIFPVPVLSHLIQSKVYLQELATRGHNVTVVSDFPNKNPIPNYNDINLGNVIVKTVPNVMLNRRKYYRNIVEGLFTLQRGIDICKMLARNDQVRDLVKRKQRFDVVVVEQFNTDCALGIAYKLDAPVVAFSTSTLWQHQYKRFGVPCNPAYMRSRFQGKITPSVYDRIVANIIEFYHTILAKIQQWVDQYTLAEFYKEIPWLEDLARDIKIVLISQSSTVTGPALLPFNVIEVGGFHVPEAKPLTGELKKFVDEAEQGVIYINFGSLVRLSDIPNEAQDAIFEALKEFPQRIVLRYDGQPLNVDKKKLYSSKWLPQVDILAHPKTLVFFSHAGLGSAFEALHHGVPMVNVPFFADQYGTAAAIEDIGFGVEIDVIDKHSIKSAIKKVLDPMFQAKAMQLSKLYNDRPMSPLDTAVYWTEFVGRNANFTYRTPAADTPLYQHLYLDVAAVVIFILFIIVYITKKVFNLIYCIIRKSVIRLRERKSKSE